MRLRRTPPPTREYRFVLACCGLGYAALLLVAVAGRWLWAQVLAASLNVLVVGATLWFVAFVNRLRGAEETRPPPDPT